MKAWIIAVNEWKQLLREREAVFWIFIGPVIFVTFFGFLMKPQEPQPLRIAVLNQDRSERLADALTTLLEQEEVEVLRVEELPDSLRTLVIHEGATASLEAGEPIKLVLRTGEEASFQERNLQFKVHKALTGIYLNGIPDPSGADTEESSGSSALIRFTSGDLGANPRKMTAGYQRSVPAYMVMFVFMNLLIGGSTIAEDQASGRLRRIALAPVRKRDIVLGKLLSRFAVGWIQVIYLLLIGIFVFRIEWAERSWVFFVFMSIFAASSVSTGIFLGTLFKDPDKAINVTIWVAILLAPLGGLWWPLEVVGPTMRRIADFVPTGWAMQGVNNMLAFGAGPRELAPYALAFVGLFAVTFTLASRRINPALGP